MGLRQLTPPANLPVDESRVQQQLGLYDDHGEQIRELVEAAVVRAETYLGRALITQTLLLTLDEFPSGHIVLPRPRLQAVAEIRYLDGEGVQQTLDEALYRVSSSREPAIITPAYGESWPSTRPVIEAIEIEYTAGYGDTGSAVPANIRHAITMMVGEWMEFREGMVVGTIAEEIPNSVRFLLNGERVGGLFAAAGED